MKIVTVPAQVTTVEDKIVGSLNLMQLILLLTPVILFGFFYSFLPPFVSLSTYKIFLVLSITCFTSPLALRIKDVLIIDWLKSITAFYVRPKYYVYTKSDMYLRKIWKDDCETNSTNEVTKQDQATDIKPASIEDRIRFEHALNKAGVDFRIKPTKKGSIHVITKNE